MVDRIFQTGLLTLCLCVIYCLIMAPITPGFATIENFSNVLVAMLPLLVVATGQTVVLITAGIDLSVTSMVALTSIAGAALITADGGPLAENPLGTPIAVIVMIGLGSTIGFVNGACIAWLRMAPFIVTLTTKMFVSGLAIWLTQTKSIYNLPESFLAFGQNVWVTLTVTILVATVVHLLLRNTLFGVGLHAIGNNIQTAHVSGVPVQRVTIGAYLLCGACAGIASILITGQLETGSPVQWESNLLDVIGATVIGGTSLFGGRGSVIWTASGVLLLSLIDNSLNLLNRSHFEIMMAKGAIILFAALMDTLRHRRGTS